MDRYDKILEEHRKKRKKEREEELAQWNKNNPDQMISVDDLLPVRTITDEDRTWFLEGLFVDGYNFGDTTRTLMGTATDASKNIIRGVLNAGEGILDAGTFAVGKAAETLGFDDFANKTYTFQQRNLVEEVNEKSKALDRILLGTPQELVEMTPKVIDEERMSLLGDKSDSLIQSAGQLGATIGLQGVGVPWWLTTGTTVFGQSSTEAMQQGATSNEAAAYGAISAGSEIIFERLSGGIKFGGKALDDGLKKLITDKISSKTLNTLARFGLDAAGEGVEEVLTEVATKVGEKLTFEDEKTWGELLTSEEAMDNYLEAFIGGAVMGGGFNAGRVAKSLKTGRDYDTGLSENEEAVVKKELENRISKKENVLAEKKKKSETDKFVEEYVKKKTSGMELSEEQIENYKRDALNEFDESTIDYSKEKLSKKELAKLEDGVIEDLKRGDIDMSVIEDVFIGREIEDIKNLMGEMNKELTEEQKAEIQAKMDEIRDSGNNRLNRILEESEFLNESFLQKLKKSEALDYKLDENTSEKAMKIVQSAIDKGANNTRKMHEQIEFVTKVAEDTGLEVVYVNDEDLENLGYYKDETTKQIMQLKNEMQNADATRKAELQKEIEALRTKRDTFIEGTAVKGKNQILLNVNSTRALEVIMGHEVTRYTESSEHYTKLNKFLKEYAGDEYQRLLETKKKFYNEEDVDQEVTADLVGEHIFTDKDFVMNLSVKEPNAFKRIYESIKHAYKMATAGSAEARKLEKAKWMFEKAYREIDKEVSRQGNKHYLLEREDALHEGKHFAKDLFTYEGVLPAHAETVPKYEETVPKYEETVPKYEETVPKYEETVSKMESVGAVSAPEWTVENDVWEADPTMFEDNQEQAEEKNKSRKELRRELIASERDFIIKAMDNAKNLPIAMMNNTDTIRVTEMVFGRKNGKKLNDLIFQKAIDNEARSIAWQNKQRTDIKALGIKTSSKMSAAVQKYGEGEYVDEYGDLRRYGDDELAREFPKLDDQVKIRNAAAFIRQKYDEYIDSANAVLTKQGFDPIPKIDNYMRHFQVLNDVFSKNGIPFNPQSMAEHNLPTDINGLTEFWSPQKQFFANALPRKGKRTTLDAIQGVDGYIGGIANLIFHTEDIQRGRALEDMTRETFGEEHGWDNAENLPDELKAERMEKIQNNHLSNYAAWVHEWTNNMAGKKNKVDRSVEAMFGRRAFAFLDQARKQVGSNMIGLNLSSSLTNFIAPVQAASKTSKMALAKGTADTVKNIFKKDGFAEKNAFLINRMGTDMLTKTKWSKMTDAGFIFMKGADWFTSNQIVRSKYHELIAKGRTEQQAHAEAGQFAARIMGDRTRGAQPALYNSKLIGLITQFQLEVNNQMYSMFYDTYHESKESAKGSALKTAAGMTFVLGQLAAYTHVFGQTFEAVAGYNPTFDIVEIIKTALGWGDDDEKTTTERLKDAANQLADALPYVNLFTDGGRIPITSGIPNLIGVATGGTDKYGNELTLGDELKKAALLFSPTGANQVKKTYQGFKLFDKDLPVAGSYTESGNLRFPVEPTPENILQALLFGQWANKNAREYFDGEHKPLKENQIQEYKELDLPIAEYWKIREDMAKIPLNDEKVDYIDTLDLPLSKKNILVNNVLDREEKVDMAGYENYSSFEEFDFAVKNPDKYPMTKAVGGYEAYKKYSEELYEIKADKDETGNSIRGTRKTKVIEYIEGMDADYGTKILLYKKEYPSDDSYNHDIIDYLNEREDISYAEMKTILESLDFTVDDEGNIWW